MTAVPARSHVTPFVLATVIFLTAGGVATAQPAGPIVPETAAPAPAFTPGPAGVPLPAPSPPAGTIMPGATPSGLPAAPNVEEVPGFFDIGGRVRKGISDWFAELVASALNPALDLLGRSVLATPDVTGPGRVRELWTVSAGLANTAFVLYVLAGGVIVMSHETLQTRYAAKQIAPRLVIGMIAANTSLALAGPAIGLANALSAALLGDGVDPAQATATMKAVVLATIDSGGIFFVLIGLVLAVLAVVLGACWIIRIALVVLLVAGAPILLACHALPQTEGLAKLWWRALAACLGVQAAQSLVLVAAVRIFFAADGRAGLGLTSGGLVDLLVIACLLYVLLRIPIWAGRMVFTSHGSSLVRTVKYYLTARVVRAGLGER